GTGIVARDHVGAEPDQDVDEDDGRADRTQRTLATELTDGGKPSKSPGGLGDLGGGFGGSADRHHRNRILGSSQAYARSTRKLTKMNTNATSMTRACVSVEVRVAAALGERKRKPSRTHNVAVTRS